jgi:hypothetical protein
MGYQESYMRMKDSNDFNKLVEVIKKNGEDNFLLAYPVCIITLLKPIKGNLEMQCQIGEYSFDSGEKFIYVVGERSGQRAAKFFFEDCKSVPKNIIDNLEIYFTECFPSYDIFENNDKTQTAIHEEFVWV